MAVDGYKFLGWISTAEVQKDSAVWNYIYDVAGDSYTTSDPDKVAPYLVTRDSKVTQSQDAYPVYAKYDIRYTTNLHRSGFDGIKGEVNVPNYQIAPRINASTDPATATVTPDVDTTVYADGTAGQPNQLYAFVGWTQVKPSGASKYVIWSDKTPW